MLQGIRDSAQGWIAWVIVILITIPFALWGIQEYFGADPNIAVADVNGTEIPLSEFQIALQRRQQALAGSPLAPEQGQVKTDTIEGLIEDQLLLQAGDSEGLRISDELLASAITTNPSFVIDGRFDQAAYDSFVARAGFSPGRFEETLRQNMLSQQLASAYVIAAVATEDAVSRLRGLQTQKRRYREMIVRSENYLGTAVSDESVSKYYEANRARYVTEEEVQVQYLLLERSALEASITADDETLRSEYDNRIASFTQPEQRRASHILVAVNDSVDDAAALARINAAKAALDAGGEFAEVAKEYSEDPGSAEKGGDLGFFGKGLMDPAFEEAAFSAVRDVIGEPVRSSFGYHLIKVTDVRAARVKAFEEAREQVLREVQRLQGEQLYFEQVENLSNLAFEHPDNLEVAAETLGLKLHTTGFFSRSGLTDDVLFSDPKVVEAAFAPEVRDEGNNSDPIEIDGNRVVVLRVIEYRPSEQRSVEDAREEIVEALEEDAARAKAYEEGKALLAKLRGGATPASVEDGEARAWSAEKEASRTAFDIPEAIRTALFRMTRPSEGDVVYDASVDNDGNFRILRLLAVENGADDGVEEAQLKLARQGLARLTGRSTYRAFVDALKAEASIEIYTDRL